MKASIQITVLLLSVSILLPNGRGQGTFQNLNFDSSPINLGNSGGVNYYTIPYWSAIMGPYQGGVTLNTYVLDATTVSLQTGTSFNPIGGTTSIFLTASSFGYPLSTASISQTALVPTTAKSIHFNVADVLAFQLSSTLPGQFFLTMGGENIPLQIIANYSSYTELAGNISDWSGQTTALSIGVSVPASQGPEIYFQGAIDDISFSPTSVPEPITIALGVLAAGGWLLCMRIRS